MTRFERHPHRRPGPTARLLVAMSALAASVAGCGGTDLEAAPPDQTDVSAVVTTGATASSTSTTSAHVPTAPSTDTTSAPPVVSAPSAASPRSTSRPSSPPPLAPGPTPTSPTDPRVTRVTAADLGASWRAGCPVGPNDLRRVSVTYVGFDGADHVGALVVHVDAVSATLQVFDRLRAARFPIRKIVTVDRYGASDDASMADDNTSAFNCRPSTGSTSTWSQHAYGRAVDVNPVENPYVTRSSVAPTAGAAFVDRSDVRPGMAVAGNALVTEFAAVGWGWGGNWVSVSDHQHFSATGR